MRPSASGCWPGVNMSYEELAERAATYSLSMDELDVWHTIEGVDYLLDGDS